MRQKNKMDIDFIDDRIKAEPLNLPNYKPNFKLIKQNFYQEEERAYIMQMFISLIILLLIVVII